MKKIAIMLVVASILLSGNAFAENADATSQGKLVIGGTEGANGTSKAIEIGLSPKVVARYVTDGTDTVDAQWYAIAAVHPGGNQGYATAANLNNIASRNYTTGAAVSDITDAIPTTKTGEWSISDDPASGWTGISQPVGADEEPEPEG